MQALTHWEGVWSQRLWQNRHIKACCYGSCCERISECAFKYIEKEKYSEKEKLDDKNNIEKALIQAKVELGTVELEIKTLKLKVEKKSCITKSITIKKYLQLKFFVWKRKSIYYHPK